MKSQRANTVELIASSSGMDLTCECNPRITNHFIASLWCGCDPHAEWDHHRMEWCVALRLSLSRVPSCFVGVICAPRHCDVPDHETFLFLSTATSCLKSPLENLWAYAAHPIKHAQRGDWWKLSVCFPACESDMTLNFISSSAKWRKSGLTVDDTCCIIQFPFRNYFISRGREIP